MDNTLKISFSGNETDREFAISPDRPLTKLDAASAKAYEANMRAGEAQDKGPAQPATQKQSINQKLFALVCAKEVCPKLNMIRVTKGFEKKNMMHPVDWGVIIWPADGKEYIAIIFEQPSDAPEKVMEWLEKPFTPFNDENITSFIKGTLPVLQKLHSARLSHGNIRPTNLYYKDRDKRSVVLGEAVSSSLGDEQNAIFEPIERAMANPYGKGKTTIKDDLYSLGVTAAFLALGQNPLFADQSLTSSVSVDALDARTHKHLYQRINFGSFFATASRIKVSPRIIYLFRGLLEDNPEDRWGLEELEAWATGKIPHVNQPNIHKNDKGVMYKEYSHTNLKSLTHAITEDYVDGISKLFSGGFDTFIKARIIDADSDTISLDKIVGALRSSTGSMKSDVHLARVAMTIDKRAPIRYKRISVMPHGIGTLTIKSLNDDEDVERLCEFVQNDIFSFWIQQDEKRQDQHIKMASLLKKHFLKQAFSEGIEKGLYILNPNLACLSEVLQNYCVTRPTNIVYKLEEALKKDKKIDLIDQHIAAFISAHMNIPQSWSAEVQLDDKDEKKFLTMLRFLSFTQETSSNNDPVPTVCDWFARRLDKNIIHFKSKDRKKQLIKKAQKIAKKGVLKPMLETLDSAEEKALDQQEFNEAQKKYVDLEKKIILTNKDQIKYASKNNPFGWQVANFVSFALLVMTIIMVMKG